ncbi:hypothetical protein [Prosthecomicrobium hirschii]|uniref:hypothetical protein n=1 Tax=Prosthecodimorpha hirschii TaxID=665126 RepID=UPI0022205056|nr:hypothetical protein [Prosthecomicrobium hirschii]MCW1843954.1 hypothetical protein [Prosthecomicrobium hirschii]
MVNLTSPPGYSASVVAQLMTMRSQMEDLSRQLGTGMKATTYGGLGTERSVAVSLRSKLENTGAFQQTIGLMDIRLKTTSTTLTHMQNVIDETRKAFDPNQFNLLSDGVTGQQKNAYNALNEFLGLMNSETAGRYMFGGRQTDKPPAETIDRIMDGFGTQAGFKQVMAERRLADLGTGNGRLSLTAAAGVVTLAEDGSHPFGFKLNAVTSSLANATVAAPSGSPQTTSVTFTGQPAVGQSLTVTLDMPDGTSTSVTVKVGETTEPDKGLFALGATPDDTAANLQSVLANRLAFAAGTDLTAASAVAASGNFFDTFGGQAPQRVDGPPFDTATALVDGTVANTMQWYKGENGALAPGASPRNQVQAQVDTNVSISYGMRGNEEAFTWNMRQFAVMAAVDMSAGGTTEKALQSSLASKLKANLASPPGTQTLTSVAMEIALAQQGNKQAGERHTQTAGTVQTFLDGIEQSDKNEVGVKMLALQTSMQASYQATSILYKLSLTNYM